MFNTIMVAVQFFFTVVIGMYFFSQLRGQQSSKNGLEADSKKELERLNRMRRISLTEPLTERTRPAALNEIVGQEAGVKALKVALCGPNPQHILIYGPPGIGKTAAARVALEEAKKNEASPFSEESKFIETDATTMRFDERSIADPLIGSVHDPIYQGAGAYGPAGVPQPKEGAVSKAHGGVLFIDEIGELHPVQINKLLKVLEDRKVIFESAYYSEQNKNIPKHIHDIFANGLPADFRLVGATTRNPEDIPPAIRSRCVEIFFRNLEEEDLKKIIDNAVQKLDLELEEEVGEMICRYAQNGRDAVRMLQTLAGVAALEKRRSICVTDVEWVAEMGHYTPRYDFKIQPGRRVGVVNGLAVSGGGSGIVMSIEVTAEKTAKGQGRFTCSGIMETESIQAGSQRLSRTSTAKAAVHNVMTALRMVAGIVVSDYNIHINFPGGMPVDGPSAGIAIFCCCYSSIRNLEIDNSFAFTGEVSIKGLVKPVGGVSAKIEAAKRAGAARVIIPKENDQKSFHNLGIEVIAIERLEELLHLVFGEEAADSAEKVVDIIAAQPQNGIASAEEVK